MTDVFRFTLDATQVRKDLDAVRMGASREVSKVMVRAGAPVLTVAQLLTPLGPGRDGKAGDHRLDHIRDTLTMTARGSVLTLSSRHPGAAVLNFGGQISPHGVEIKFPPRLMAQTAGELALPRLERELERGISELLARHGL